MFERYTERARRVLFFARYEASQLGSMSIETEHLLLGLIREGKGLTSRIFARSHLSLENIRKEIEGRTVFREKVSTSVEMPLSAETKRVLQCAAEEADRLLHNARESVRRDPGCLRFDVSQDKETPARWVLYEVYESPEAHAAHRLTPHFLAYNDVAARAVVSKTVLKYVGRHVT